MLRNRHTIQEAWGLPVLLFMLGCCLLAFLLSSVQPDVFYSGDGGLKFLVLKQMAAHGRQLVVETHPQNWVRAIWSEGFYPFKPPFVYDAPGGKIISFPPFFQWVSVPLYRYFGYKGLYVIPAASVALFWTWFIISLQRWKINRPTANACFFAVIFCSPVTMYGAMYWEHTFSILLLFAGIVFLVSKPGSIRLSAALGGLTGLSGWMRPELIVLCCLFIFAAIVNFSRRKNPGHLVFALSAGLVISAFFVFNRVAYGSLLGAHGNQFLNETPFLTKLGDALILLVHVHAKFIVFFPFSLLFYAFASYLIIRRPAMPAVIYQLTLITIGLSLITPFFMPNGGGKQWGPRYFLPLVPLMLVTLCLGVRHLNLSLRQNRILFATLVVLNLYGFYINTVRGPISISNDYAFRVTPGMNFMKTKACDVIVVQNQYIAQEFAALFHEKKFFLAETEKSLELLIGKLKSSGVSQIIYVSSANETKPFANRINHSGKLQPIGNYFFAVYFLSNP